MDYDSHQNKLSVGRSKANQLFCRNESTSTQGWNVTSSRALAHSCVPAQSSSELFRAMNWAFIEA